MNERKKHKNKLVLVQLQVLSIVLLKEILLLHVPLSRYKPFCPCVLPFSVLPNLHLQAIMLPMIKWPNLLSLTATHIATSTETVAARSKLKFYFRDITVLYKPIIREIMRLIGFLLLLCMCVRVHIIISLPVLRALHGRENVVFFSLTIFWRIDCTLERPKPLCFTKQQQALCQQRSWTLVLDARPDQCIFFFLWGLVEEEMHLQNTAPHNELHSVIQEN